MFDFLTAALQAGHTPAFVLTALSSNEVESPHNATYYDVPDSKGYICYIPQYIHHDSNAADPTVCIAQLRIAAGSAMPGKIDQVLPDCILSMHINCITYEICVRTHDQMELFVGPESHPCYPSENSVYLATSVAEHQVGFITPAGVHVAFKLQWTDSWLDRKLVLQLGKPWTSMMPRAGNEIYDQSLTFRYAEDETLGRGGFSSVVKSMHVDSGAVVAVKQTTFCLTSFRGIAVIREAFILSQLNHPSIIEFIRADIGNPHEGIDVVLAFKTVDLATAIHTQRMHQNAKTNIERFMHQMLEALQYLAARRIVHYDIKPGNILCAPVRTAFPNFEQTWDFWLTDFNVAMPIGTPVSYGATMGFEPPEFGDPMLQMPGMAATLTLQPSMDIYSLFVTLTVMVSSIAGAKAKDPSLLFFNNLCETPTHKFVEASIQLDNVLHTLRLMGSKYPGLRPTATQLLNLHFPGCSGSCFARRGATIEPIASVKPLEIPAEFLECPDDLECPECNTYASGDNEIAAVKLLERVLLERSQRLMVDNARRQMFGTE